MYRIRINCHDVFTISHPSEGTFRLEIHASPDELDPDEARRLRAVLLGLAAELEREESPSNTDREGGGWARESESAEIRVTFRPKAAIRAVFSSSAPAGARDPDLFRAFPSEILAFGESQARAHQAAPPEVRVAEAEEPVARKGPGRGDREDASRRRLRSLTDTISHSRRGDLPTVL